MKSKLIKGSVVSGILGILCICAVAPVSATSSTSVEIDFTLNQSLTATLSSNDIYIHDISPGAFRNSNTVTLNVESNNPTGYVVSAAVGGNTTDLTKSGTADKFTSIASNADLATLTTDDTWGYSLKIGTSTGNGTSVAKSGDPGTWSNYNGLTTTASPIFSTSEPTIAGINLRIAAKASDDIEPGEYTNSINFSIVTNLVPVSAADAFDAAAASNPNITKVNGFYKMQDMTSTICSNITTPSAADYSDTPELQLIDTRDNKVYWVAKLKDGHCWMTQNLDFDIPTTTLTSADTDLTQYGVGGYTTDNGYSQSGTTISWAPERATIPSSAISSGTITGWNNDNNNPYSADTGDWYWTDTWYDNACASSPWCNYLTGNQGNKFSQTPYTGNGTHGHVGNYYNWTSAIASNDSSSYTTSTMDDISASPQNSVCPAGWRLPTISSSASVAPGSTNEFAVLKALYPATGDNGFTARPLFFVRGGIVSVTLYHSGSGGNYLSNTVASGNSVWALKVGSSNVGMEGASRFYGRSLRCVAH